jgi:hypothetical protein
VEEDLRPPRNPSDDLLVFLLDPDQQNVDALLTGMAAIDGGVDAGETAQEQSGGSAGTHNLSCDHDQFSVRPLNTDAQRRGTGPGVVISVGAFSGAVRKVPCQLPALWRRLPWKHSNMVADLWSFLPDRIHTSRYGAV